MRILLLLPVLALPIMGIARSLSTLDIDLTGDGILDQAILIPNPGKDLADLQITTENGEYLYTDLVFFGAFEGQEASLAATTPGQFDIISGNRSKGSRRWDQTLTIVWQDEAFRVSSLSRSWWDSVTADDDGQCEIDYLSGIGVADGPDGAMEIRIETLAPALETWDQELPEACKT